MDLLEPRGSNTARFRAQCLALAAAGLRMPIGTDLLLHEQADPDAVRLDGRRLADVVLAAAERYRTPLAMPLMDLRVEKRDLLRRLGVDAAELDTFHFDKPLDDATLCRARETLDAPYDALMAGQIGAVREVAARGDVTPIGMAIGPFSLTVKLMRDPITAVARASRTPNHSQVVLLTQVLSIATDAVRRAIRAQATAGAQALCLCEPAANTVYLSPKQLQGDDNPFERFVMRPHEELRREIATRDLGLIFHNCGDLVDAFVAAFAQRLRPAILSLGSSRDLAHDAALVPPDVVLYGNLPTKHFYDDGALPIEHVAALTCALQARMAATGHPFVLGSECDVLSVTGSHELIAGKVARMLECDCS